MFYKSVFIHKNRIFLYFQNKVKNVNNIIIIIIIIIIIMIIIIIIIIIIKITKLVIQKKMYKEKRYNGYEIILNLVLFRINLA